MQKGERQVEFVFCLSVPLPSHFPHAHSRTRASDSGLQFFFLHALSKCYTCFSGDLNTDRREYCRAVT